MRSFRALPFFTAALCVLLAAPGHAAERTRVSIFLVRHAETDTTQPTLPLTALGQQRAQLLARTLQPIRFTHVFSSHTTRSRQTVDDVARANELAVVQLPAPGSMLDGERVTEQTSRRAPIEPVAAALLSLPAGSVALAGLNSENIFAILNRLDVPLAAGADGCARGSVCVPCTSNSCFPLMEYDRIWHVVIEPGQARPLAFEEMRYAQGWEPTAAAAPQK